MKYQFLHVANFQGREYAYLIDLERNCVVRMPVYDTEPQTTSHAPSARMPMRDETYHAPLPRIEMPEHAVFDQSSPQPRTDLPDKPPSIMPPGLAAMMRDGNEMGPNGY